LTPEQERLGKGQLSRGSRVSRRKFLVEPLRPCRRWAPRISAMEPWKGDPIKVGSHRGSGDEGSVLLTQHPQEYALEHAQVFHRNALSLVGRREIRWGWIP